MQNDSLDSDLILCITQHIYGGHVCVYICTYIPQELMLSKSTVLTEEKNISDVCLTGEAYEIHFKGNVNTSPLLYSVAF